MSTQQRFVVLIDSDASPVLDIDLEKLISNALGLADEDRVRVYGG